MTTQQPNNTAPSNVVLRAENLAKCYKKRWVVDGVSLDVSAGSISGLLGPNGAGKTTSFYMIVGLIRPDRGTVLLNGQNITHTAIHKRARLGIGYLPQDASIFQNMSVRDNILSVLECRRDLRGGRARREACDQLIERFNLQHVATSLGMQVSGGERRRVEIARCMAMSPRLILLDEPFAGIDPVTVQELKTLLRELRDEGLAILITDHNVRDTLALCDHASVVYQGKILVQGCAQTIIDHEEVRRVYLGNDYTL